MNMAIKMSVGVEGVDRSALAFRDQIVAAGLADLANVRAEDFLRFLRNGLVAVPGLTNVSIPHMRLKMRPTCHRKMWHRQRPRFLALGTFNVRAKSMVLGPMPNFLKGGRAAHSVPRIKFG